MGVTKTVNPRDAPLASNADRRFAAWSQQLERLFQQAAGLAHADHVYRQVHAVMHANDELRQGGVFQSWLQESYACRIIVGLRTLSDGAKDTVSLLRLLDDMARHGHEILTWERFSSLYPPELRHRADRDFDDIGGNGLDHLPKRVIHIWKRKLEEAFSVVEVYANSEVAHLAANRTVPVPTFADVRRALKTAEEAISWLTMVLQAMSMSSIEPEIQENWTRVFRFVWLAEGAPLPPLRRLRDEPEVG